MFIKLVIIASPQRNSLVKNKFSSATSVFFYVNGYVLVSIYLHMAPLTHVVVS